MLCFLRREYLYLWLVNLRQVEFRRVGRVAVNQVEFVCLCENGFEYRKIPFHRRGG